MSGQSRRKALREEYDEAPPQAGVYRIVNRETGKVLLGTATNLPSVGNRLTFAQSTNSPGALDPRLQRDIRQHGLAAFAFEVVEVLAVTPTMTRSEIADDLSVLLSLWREKYEAGALY